MQHLNLNLWVVLAAAFVKFLLGGLWYSELLFAKSWKKLLGLKANGAKKGMGQAMATEFVGNLLMAFILAHAIRYAGAQGVVEGMAVGLLNWLGFIAVVQIHSVIFEKKPFKLFLINTGFQLVSLLIMGAILVLWV